MSLQQLRSVDFGKSRANLTGSSGVGYTLLTDAGGTHQTRTTTSVYQLTSGSGIYAAYISFPDVFHGSILWDTGQSGSLLAYATEQYNTEENDARILPMLTIVSSSVQHVSATINVLSGSIDFLVDMEGGRWKIESNQMKFYKSDGSTLVATFNLFDSLGAPSMGEVFDRRRV